MEADNINLYIKYRACRLRINKTVKIVFFDSNKINSYLPLSPLGILS